MPRERKRLGKLTQKQLQTKLSDLRSRRGQQPIEAKETRRHLLRAEKRIVEELDRRRLEREK